MLQGCAAAALLLATAMGACRTTPPSSCYNIAGKPCLCHLLARLQVYPVPPPRQLHHQGRSPSIRPLRPRLRRAPPRRLFPAPPCLGHLTPSHHLASRSSSAKDAKTLPWMRQEPLPRLPVFFEDRQVPLYQTLERLPSLFTRAPFVSLCLDRQERDAPSTSTRTSTTHEQLPSPRSRVSLPSP